MFHVILFSLLALHLTQGLPIPIGTSNSTMQIISARLKNDFQIVITLKAQLDEQIKLSAAALSQNHVYHQLKIKKQQIIVSPKLEDEKVIFNYKHEDEYLLALSHKIKQQDFLFLPIEVESNNVVTQLFLPALDTKMHQMERNLLLKCHNTVIYVQVQHQTDSIHLVFFTKDKKESIWFPQGNNWTKQWRHYSQGTFFGAAHRSGTKDPIKILLSGGHYCKFDPLNLPTFALNKQPIIQPREYYTIEDLLRQIPPLEMKKQQLNNDEEEL